MSIYNYTRIVIVGLFLVVPIPKGLYAQLCDSLRSESFELKLDSLKVEKNLSEYYSQIRKLTRQVGNGKDCECINKFSEKFNLFPQNEKDSLKLRGHFSIQARQEGFYCNNYFEAQNILLKANSFLKDKAKGDKWSWYVENELGHIYARLNEYDKAFYYYSIVMSYLKEDASLNNQKKLARLYRNIGDVYKWLDEEEKMLLAYRIGIDLAKTINYSTALQTLFAATTDYYIQIRDIEQAQKYLDSTKTYFVDLPQREKRSRQTGVNLLEAELAYLRQNYAESILHFKNSLSASPLDSKISREKAKIYLRISQSFDKTSEADSLNFYYKKALSFLIKDYNNEEIPKRTLVHSENTFVDLLHLKSKYYNDKFLNSNNSRFIDSLFQCSLLALEINESLEKELLQKESKFISLRTNRELVDNTIKDLYEYYLQSKDQQALSKVRNLLDFSKNKLVQQNLERSKKRTKLNANDLDRLQELERQLIHLNLAKESEERSKSKLEIELEIESIYSGVKDFRVDTKRVKEPYIEYLVSVDSIYIYWEKDGSKGLNSAPTKELKSYQDTLNNCLLNQAECQNILKLLFDKLIPNQLKSSNRITIIPDGFLCTVPFDILKNQDRYFFENTTITIQPSHLYIKNEKQRVKEKQMLILVPTYSQNKEAETLAVRGDIVHLPYAEKEVEGIESIMKTKTEKLSRIELDDIQEKFRDYAIFHFAGHAIAKEEASYLALSSEDSKENRIYQEQILNAYNEFDLVTLSACETGLGEFKTGQGIQSLSSSFLYSGSSSVVYSLWQVNDQSTEKLMRAFYKYLNDGLEKDKALNKAKLEFIKSASPQEQHPYYWAGFTFCGDNQAIVNQPKYFMIMACAIVLLTLFFIIKKLK